MDSSTQHAIEWIAGIVLLAAFIGVVFFWRVVPQAPTEQSGYTNLQRLLPPGTPAPTAADYVTAQHGFNELVQLTDNGPRPASLTVKKGDTVRFTNLGSATVTITMNDGMHATIIHGAYWEQVFSATGTFTYTDGLSHQGTIIVQ